LNFNIQYEANGEGEMEITNGENATQIDIDCNTDKIQSLFSISNNWT